MLSSVEQAFVGRDEKRAPLKTPAWEATTKCNCSSKIHFILIIVVVAADFSTRVLFQPGILDHFRTSLFQAPR